MDARVTEAFGLAGLTEISRPKREWLVEIVSAGFTADARRFYSPEVLEVAAAGGVYDGKKMFWNHERPGPKPPHRDLRDWVSTVLPGEVRVRDGNLQALVHAHHPDLLLLLQDEMTRGQIGISVDHRVRERAEVMDGRATRVVEEISECFSVDWVPEGNAHGRVLEAHFGAPDELRAQSAYEVAWMEHARRTGMPEQQIVRLQQAVGRG